MSNVVIFGTGDFGSVAHLYLTEESEHSVIGFTTEEAYLPGKEFEGLPTFPFERLEHEVPPAETSMLIATGPAKVNQQRARFFAAAKKKGYRLISFVSPRAQFWPDTPIGENSFVFEGTVVEPYSRIGDNTILWSGAAIAHHAEIGNHCFLAPRVAISGRVVVEDYCFLGINCTVRDHVRIGESSVIGAGALIKKDTRAHAVYSARRTEIYKTDSSDANL